MGKRIVTEKGGIAFATKHHGENALGDLFARPTLP
jgi:hypothetical protein